MKRVAAAVLLLTLLGVAACGDDEAAPPAAEVQGGEARQGEGKARPEPWLGYWESSARSKGGIGSAIYITPKGRALTWTCVLVDGTYSVDGDRLTLADDSKAMRIRIDGERMTQIVDGKTAAEMTRVGTGEGIVGVWRYEHYVGHEAFQRYGADGGLSFRLIMGTIVGRSYERLGEDSIALKAGKRLERAVLRVRDDELVGDDAKGYVRVGEKPWYPLP